MGDLIAKIAVSGATYSIDKPYDYLVPEHLAPGLLPGMRVIVPFARANKRQEGMVLGLSEESKSTRLKPIDRVLDLEPVLDEGQLKLALWMRERFFCTVYDGVRAMLPTGLWHKISSAYRVAAGFNRPTAEAAGNHHPTAIAVLDILFASKTPVSQRAIEKALGEHGAMAGLKRLLDANAIEKVSSDRRRVNDKTQKFVSLCISAEEAQQLAAQRQKTAKKQAELLSFLAASGTVSTKELNYYTGVTMATVKALEKIGFLQVEAKEVLRRPQFSRAAVSTDENLSPEQEAVCKGLLALYEEDKAQAALLHGVTGSGKTAVYLHLIDQAIKGGKGAIVLVPEIALTPQLMGKFTARFGEQVAVLHSALGLGERYDEWKRIKSGSAPVVVGTRSAVFAPVSNLGLIVIDEEQEHTYKSESAPRYHARDVAKYRAAQAKALLLMGSATPSVESSYHVAQGRYHGFRLENRYNQMALPRVIVADMKENLKAGNGTNLSFQLQEELEKNINAGEQSILFLNRRGTSNLLLCGSCGYTFSCDHCSVNLTYHQANKRLMCHYCGKSRRVEEECPDCDGFLKYVGAGTQKIEEELKARFPGVGVLRMDADTIKIGRASCRERV